MMVSSRASNGATESALSIVRSILRSNGVAGLYRGFGITLISYLPGSSIWWGSYGGARACLSRSLPGMPDPGSTLLAATWAAGCTVLATNPLDTLKTRVQLDQGTSPSLAAHVRTLYEAEGVRGMYRGVLPRAMHLTIWGGCIIMLYEELKRRCVLQTASA